MVVVPAGSIDEEDGVLAREAGDEVLVGQTYLKPDPLELEVGGLA